MFNVCAGIHYKSVQRTSLFLFPLIHHGMMNFCCWNYQVAEDEVSGACRTAVGEEECLVSW
jgi:hypothetical protein